MGEAADKIVGDAINWGTIRVVIGPEYGPAAHQFCLLIQFKDAADLHRTLEARRVEFRLFGVVEDNEGDERGASR